MCCACFDACTCSHARVLCTQGRVACRAANRRKVPATARGKGHITRSSLSRTTHYRNMIQSRRNCSQLREEFGQTTGMTVSDHSSRTCILSERVVPREEEGAEARGDGCATEANEHTPACMSTPSRSAEDAVPPKSTPPQDLSKALLDAVLSLCRLVSTFQDLDQSVFFRKHMFCQSVF